MGLFDKLFGKKEQKESLEQGLQKTKEGFFGKTTTIGKLAHNFSLAGKSVLLGASDTFRAAAVDQLTIWSERASVPIIKHGMGADPSAVAFDTVQSGISKNTDVILIDTAGRL